MVRDQAWHAPSYWWIFDAPRLPEEQHGDYAGCFFAPDLIVPRMRLGGKGTPTHEVLACVPDFDLGVPENWTSDSDISCYNTIVLFVQNGSIRSTRLASNLRRPIFGEWRY
ncbi:MAG: hypothetical protein M3Q32_04120 [Pseudomonadota bacterium]|nr:hypothetical protein [Pseudomonadota bacterium]